jgi:hypothetical protein
MTWELKTKILTRTQTERAEVDGADIAGKGS